MLLLYIIIVNLNIRRSFLLYSGSKIAFKYFKIRFKNVVHFIMRYTKKDKMELSRKFTFCSYGIRYYDLQEQYTTRSRDR